MNKVYIINKTLANLVFRNGYINIPRGGYSAVSAEDASSSEFVMAHERGWIETSEGIPATVSVKPAETTEVQSPAQGMTEVELLLDLAKGKAPTPTATMEALGAGSTSGNEPTPAVVTAFGQESPEVAPEVEAEPTRKSIRKAKAT